MCVCVGGCVCVCVCVWCVWLTLFETKPSDNKHTQKKEKKGKKVCWVGGIIWWFFTIIINPQTPTTPFYYNTTFLCLLESRFGDLCVWLRGCVWRDGRGWFFLFLFLPHNQQKQNTHTNPPNTTLPNPWLIFWTNSLYTYTGGWSLLVGCWTFLDSLGWLSQSVVSKNQHTQQNNSSSPVCVWWFCFSIFQTIN